MLRTLQWIKCHVSILTKEEISIFIKNIVMIEEKYINYKESIINKFSKMIIKYFKYMTWIEILVM